MQLGAVPSLVDRWMIAFNLFRTDEYRGCLSTIGAGRGALFLVDEVVVTPVAVMSENFV